MLSHPHSSKDARRDDATVRRGEWRGLSPNLRLLHKG